MEKIKELTDTTYNLVEETYNVLCTRGYNLKKRLYSILKLVKQLQSEVLEEEKRQNLNNTFFKFSKEMVSHPDHYKGAKYECIDIMLDVFGKEKTLAFCELNAFKYLWRSDAKGTDIQDKQKAVWYLNKYNELKQEDK